MTSTMRVAGALGVFAALGVTLAKLPAPPPPIDAQKAVAEEKKAKGRGPALSTHENGDESVPFFCAPAAGTRFANQSSSSIGNNEKNAA